MAAGRTNQEVADHLAARGLTPLGSAVEQGLAMIGQRKQAYRDNGIAELSDRHWLVVRFMRERYLKTGNAPSIRSLGKESGVPVKELYQLFPKGPAKLAAKVGGIPKPKGCI